VRVKRHAQLATAGVAGLALADAGVVALALPPILLALHTTVAGVAAVLGVYALVLGLALPVAGHLAVRDPSRVGVAGVLVFAVASLGCGLVSSLPLLLVLRALQAAGGAAMLAAAFALLADGEADGGPASLASARHPGSPDRTPLASSGWRAATLLGTATGPALGGAITQVLGWRAIFLVQAPLVLLALPAFLRAARPRVAEGGPLPHSAAIVRAGIALALVSAALTAVIFLTVLLLVTGWSVEPLAAAVVVSVLPVAAVAGARVRGSPAARAAAGSLLVGTGTACLAFVPTDSLWWVVGPEAIAGVGMGMALPALAGELLPERTVRQATALLCTRHLGIAVGLAILAPVMTSSIDDGLYTARLHGAALILDARINPTTKLDIAQQLEGAVTTDQPLAGVQEVFRENTDDIPADQRAAWDRLGRRGSETLVAAVNDAFAPGFGVGAALAALAALAIAPWPSRRTLALAAAAVALALLVPAAYALAADRAKPPPVRLGDPCKPRNLPSTGGITGVIQDTALVAIDRAACHASSSREALVVALTNDSAAQEYKDRYGVDPNSITSLLGAVIGG
jgi:MFS family permease